MPDQYLLPCACGKSIPIEKTQAGQIIECPTCQASVEVPSLSQIKKLPLQESKSEERSKVRAKKNWGYGQGVLFVTGMALLIIFGLLAGVFFYLHSGSNVETPTVDGAMKQNFGAFLDSMTPAERFAFWEDDQKKNPPKEWKPPKHLFTQTFSRTFYTLAIACSVLALVGFGCVVGAFLFKPAAR